MANLVITNTFVALAEIQAAPFNTNFSDVATYINNRNGGTPWDILAVAGTSTLTGNVSMGGTLGVTGNTTLTGTLGVTGISTLTGAVTMVSTLGVTGAITATGGIASLFGYRRPNLVPASSTGVDIENNTGTANQTTLVFPDGTIRSVTENTSSTDKYRRFLITATANFISGTEDSGLYSGLSEATNTWYAIYAVKSQINSANFVLVGTTTLPLQANFSTLNTNLGANGWIYLGMVRNGNNADATGDLLSFNMSGSKTVFKGNMTGTNSARSLPAGNLVATATASATTSYTYSAGTGTADIPDHIKIGTFLCADVSSGSNTIKTVAGGGTAIITGQTGFVHLIPDQPVDRGILFVRGTGTAGDILLTGWCDPLLDGTYQVL